MLRASMMRYHVKSIPVFQIDGATRQIGIAEGHFFEFARVVALW